MPEPDNELGRRIKAARIDRQLSIRAAAELAGFSEGRWRQIEKGYITPAAGVKVPVHPSAARLRQIARVVGLDLAELLRLGGHEAEAQDMPAYTPADSVVTAVMADPRLLPEAKSHLLNQYGLLLRIAGTPEPDAQEVREQADASLHAELAAEPTAAERLARKPGQ